MITFLRNFVVYLSFVLSLNEITDARGYGDGACKDVTVGDCNLNDDYIIDTLTLPVSSEQCQYYCNSLTDCVVFQHNAANCTLLREDYRQECNSAGGPTKNAIDTCLEVDLNTCDRFLEEDCEYYGDVLLNPNSIADPKHCQELCEEFENVGCEYWTYQENECFLLSSSERSCTTIGGPKSPDINECIVTTTTSTQPPTTKLLNTTTTEASTELPTTTILKTTTTETTTTTSTTKTTTVTTPTTTKPPICSKTKLQILDTLALENTIGNESYCCKTCATCCGEEWEFYENNTITLQVNNTYIPSIGIGSEEVMGVNYNGTFNTTSTDDDDIGIIFGYENSSNFYVIYADKFNVSNGYHENQQFKITKVNSVTGLNGPDMRNAIRNATSVPNQTEVLWKDNANRGWLTNKEYTWKLKTRPLTGNLKFELYEDSSLLFDTGVLSTNITTSGGKLGVFTNSQPNTFWYNMWYECDDSPI